MVAGPGPGQVAGLIRSLTVRWLPDVSHHSPAVLDPDRNRPTSLPAKEKRMESLADLVEVVIGVDTHKHTHTAAIVVASTGGKLEELTVATDPDGYSALVDLADRHGGARAWAIEGTGRYGAGLVRHLRDLGEWVIELDRPNRAPRRHGAKSDALDAARAAREALARETLAEPRAAGERAALQVLLAGRRSAVDGASVANRQLQAIVTAAPECLRSRFRGQTGVVMVATAARLRSSKSWDLETTTTADMLRALARRCQDLTAEATAHERQIRAIVTAWRPELLEECGVGPIVAAIVLCAWSHPGRVRNEAAFAMLAGTCPIPASSGMTIDEVLADHIDLERDDLLAALEFGALAVGQRLVRLDTA